MGSDPRLVTAKVKVSLRMRTSPPKRIYYDWSVLKNSDLQIAYAVEVKNRFSQLNIAEENISKEFSHFLQASNEATEHLIPKRKKRKRNRTVVLRKQEKVYKMLSNTMKKTRPRKIRENYKMPQVISKVFMLS